MPKKKNPRRQIGRKSSGSGKRPKKAASSPLNPAGLLIEARERYSQNELNDVLGILEGFNRRILRRNSKNAREYYRLMIFTLTNLGDYAGAEKLLEKAFELCPNEADFYFADSFIAINYKEYDRALKSGLKYLELYQDISDDKSKRILLSYHRDHLIYNYLGVAAKATNDFDGTVGYFEKAIEAQPANPIPYLNLANFYIQAKKYKEAEELVERGLNGCSQVQELEMMRKTLKNQATVSACMIVKNEEELLPGCLESIRNWVDEIIVVDTGSTDRTVEIAKEYGAKIFHQEWTGNFSFHRNYSIEQAMSDWVFIIDADEEVEQAHVPEIRQALAQDQFRTITVNVFNMDPVDKRISSHLPSIRFFRKDSGIRYDGIVHNQLQYDKGEKTLKAEVTIRHYGYNLSEDKMEKKFERTRVLLEKQIEENPDFAFAHFNLAQLYRSVNYETKPDAHNKAIYHAGRVIDLTPEHKTIHLMAHYQKAAALYKLGRFGEAEKTALKALELKGNYVDPIMLLGHVYIGMQKYDLARKYYNLYLEEQKKLAHEPLKEDILLVFVEARYVAYYNLGLIEEHTGSIEKAEEYYSLAFEERGAFENLCYRLASIYLRKNDLEKASKMIDEELVFNPQSHDALLIKARCAELKGDSDEAESYYEKAVDSNIDNADLAVKAGTFFANNGKFEKALKVFGHLTEKYPDEPQYWKDLADIYMASQDYCKARDNFQKYLELSPRDFEATTQIGACYFKLGEYEKAEQVYSAALESGEDVGFIYRNLGLVKYHLGKYKEAEALLSKYLEIVPEDLEIESAIGACYYKLESYEEAVKHLERYLRFNPHGVEALFHLAECYFKQDYIDSALLGYRQVLKISPNHPGASEKIARISPEKAEIGK